ncbi:ribbon-helix-helix domain-containing protein [Planctomycetota bacterium]
MGSINLELPPRLKEEVDALVKDGWFRAVDEVICEALRRFLESHRPDAMELAIREDTEWGLRGEE